MRLKHFLLFVLLLFIVCANSQSFSSKKEEHFFASYKSDSINYNFLKGLFLIDTTYSNENFLKADVKLNKIISSFPPKEAKDKKEKKRVKKIYDRIHNTFLKKYDKDAYFSDIFKDGTYNCVTASAIYAYTFDKLQIPYHVKEVPSHVYLIAYPKTYKIYLETTAPGSYGFYIPHDSEIKKIVNELIERKLVTEEEVSKKGYKKFYDEYFFGKEFIKKSALLGMQYHNKGIDDFVNKKFKSALNNLQKSSYFHKSVLAKLYVKELTLINLQYLEIKKNEDVDFLIENIKNLKLGEELDKNNLLILIDRVTENGLNFTEKNLDKFLKIENTELRTFIEKKVYRYLGNVNAEQQNFEKTILYGEKLLLLDENNNIAKRLITYGLVNKFSLKSYTKKTLDEFISYSKKHNFLNEDKRVKSLLVNLNGKLASDAIMTKKIKSALVYLDNIEKIMNQNKDQVFINPEIIAGLYLEVGRSYYGRSNFKTANKYFRKGLRHSPTNHELKKMLKWSKEDAQN